MKKLFLLVVFILGAVSYGLAQNLELQISADSSLVNNSYVYSIKLTISGDPAPYNIELYNKPEYKGGKLISSRLNCLENEVFFRDLDIDQVYIRVISIPRKKGIAETFHL